MNVLIIGSGGMLGHILTLYLSQNPAFSVSNLSKKNRWRQDCILLDILNRNDILNFLNSGNFDVIVNCAALLVEASEKDKTMAVEINSAFPHLLEEWSADKKTKIIQISSDGVFRGNNAPYRLDSIPDGLSFYSRTKGLGELHNEKDLTIRASFIGPELKIDGKGIFHWFYHQKGSISGYKNVVFNGITSLECAKAVEQILLHPIAGCIHLGAEQSISKGQLLNKIADIWKLKEITIHMTAYPVSDCTLTDTYQSASYRSNTYINMLTELNQWMVQYKDLYSHYR